MSSEHECNQLVELRAIMAWVEAALRGVHVSDFGASFPIVRDALDLRAALVAEKAFAWRIACEKYHKRVLEGSKRHYCFDWDGLPIDETCQEFSCCNCTWDT